MAKAKLAFQPVIALLLVISILSLFPRPVSADELSWSRVNTPSNGESGQWVLAAGSDVRHLTVASDGTLYCFANPASTAYRLFKSSDEGSSWSYAGEVTENIVDIAAVPGKPDSVYYATESNVFRSSDAGNNFNIIARNPGGAGAGNVEITSIDAALFEGNEIAVIGTGDADASQFGGVYILDQGQAFDLNDTSIGNYDVYSIDLSPDFGTSGQIVAVVTNEADTFVTTRFYNSGWGDYVGNARISGTTLKSAAVAFPADYNSRLDTGKYSQFIALNTGSDRGGIYSLKGQAAPGSSKINDLKVGSSEGLASLDITSLAIAGNADSAYLVAGANAFPGVYLSEDSGANWISCYKPPSGVSEVYVSLARDFTTSGTVYAATSGAESAFSISRDRGNNWSQLNLIDTTVTNIKDLAVSTNYIEDKTLFLITGGATDSLWSSQDGGLKWERIFSSALPQVKRINFAALSPQYSQDKTILLAGTSDFNPARWKSEDNGQSFQRLESTDPQTGAQINVDVWLITPEGTLIIGSYDGSKGLVYQGSGSGPYYSDKAVVGNLPLNSLAVSPDYGRDKTILVGNTNGEVFYSEGGSVFKSLPLDVPAPPLAGNVAVAFDPDYSRNKTVYAASDTNNGGIYRFVIGKSISWEPIDYSLPDGASVSQVVVSDNGVLYGVFSRNEAGENNKGGVERSINPTYRPRPVFETITEGVADGISLRKLWLQYRTLWTVDATNGKLLTYTDSVTSPVVLISPEDKANELNTRNIMISWESQAGVSSYHWQIDTDDGFAKIAAGFEGDTGSTSVRLPELEPGATYYWRVRATESVTSPWSAVRSFSTRKDSLLAAPEIIEPRSNVPAPLKPNFRWSTISGATQYEIQVASDEGFRELVVDKTGDNACKKNVWNCDVLLKNDTSYFWRVRAVSGSGTSEWATGIFTTEKALVVSATAATPSASPFSITVTLAPSTSPTPALTPSTSSTATPESTESSGLSRTLMRLVIFLGSGLVVMTIGMIIMIIYVLRKFRKY